MHAFPSSELLMPEEHFFDHEKLEVYQLALAFVAWLSALLETIRPAMLRISWNVPERRCR